MRGGSKSNPLRYLGIRSCPPPLPFPPRERLRERLAAKLEWRYVQAMIEAVEIERMSFSERLQAMELLWRSMSAEPAKLESPAWHKPVLQQRLAKVESGKGGFLTLTQLKKRLTKRPV